VSALTLLPSGDKWHSYSGIMTGGPTLPATVELVKIPSTGLRDTYAKISPFYALPVATAVGDALGIKIFINQVAVYESQTKDVLDRSEAPIIELFIPQQSELQILSLNTNNNTLQGRGVAVLGWSL